MNKNQTQGTKLRFQELRRALRTDSSHASDQGWDGGGGARRGRWAEVAKEVLVVERPAVSWWAILEVRAGVGPGSQSATLHVSMKR